MDELYINRNLSWKAQIHTIQKIPKISDSMSMNIQSEDHPKQMKKTEEDLNLLPESLPDRTFTPEFGRPSRRIGGLSSTKKYNQRNNLPTRLPGDGRNRSTNYS